MRARVGDPPFGATAPADRPPVWVRVPDRVPDRAPRRPDAHEPDADEPEARQTWLVDSFEIVAPRYPWRRE
ncbi:hypothetical protein [Saccharothrix obliqua]|uniref:hypothetical protein n=1 Tax=Saccharothrix obliqua TaxID=2861747 RepID=UPI001C607FD3|nr:hypothetical protein [Saccharothrix obliqua]MBW4719734.1 hypothetical protein [Saccharothrix obliqua]